MKSDERRPKRKGAPSKGRKKGTLKEAPPDEKTALMMEMDRKVEDLRATSSIRPVRVVIDEVYPGEFYRVLSAEMRTKKKDLDETDPSVWGDEVEHYMTKPQLMRLLAGTGSKEVWEGKVFRIKGKRSKNIYGLVKKRVSRDARGLLEREGRTYDERRKRW